VATSACVVLYCSDYSLAQFGVAYTDDDDEDKNRCFALRPIQGLLYMLSTH
jgi:hypothetical protein